MEEQPTNEWQIPPYLIELREISYNSFNQLRLCLWNNNKDEKGRRDDYFDMYKDSTTSVLDRFKAHFNMEDNIKAMQIRDYILTYPITYADTFEENFPELSKVDDEYNLLLVKYGVDNLLAKTIDL